MLRSAARRARRFIPPVLTFLGMGPFGMLAAWLAEFLARLFYNRGNTHFDPPAAAIWIANTIIVSLANIAAPLF